MDDKEYFEEMANERAMPVFGCVAYLLVFVVVCAVLAMMTGCRTVYVPVETVHEYHHNHTDSIHEVDSVFHEKETVIMQLDSAAMAQYGIRLKAAETAWLVRTKELERELQRIAELKADTVVRVDSIQVPVPVERKLSFFEKAKLMSTGFVTALAVGAVAALLLWIRRRYRRI